MDAGAVCFGLAVLGLLTWGVFAVRRALVQNAEIKARPRELEALGRRLGLTLSEVDPEEAPSPIDQTIFQSDCGPPANRLEGVVDGKRVAVLESTVRRGARIATYHTRACFLFEPPSGRWPRFILRAEDHALDPQDEDDSLKGCVAVEVNDEAFEEAFTLCAWNGEEVRGRFPPELRARLVAEQKAGRAFTVESLGSAVIAWKEDEESPSTDLLAQRFQEARAFVALVGSAISGR
ncbi:MAG: hypothetical protein JNJ54_03600 [Myxococcaceae bacterium]|nr:hypothetical protein [Myxococcaceae bacterium]